MGPPQLYGCFKRLTSDISRKKTWTGNLKRDSDSLLKAAQNNAIRLNHIKARIDKTADVGCVVRETKQCHIISDCSKFAQKEYKNRHDRVGKVIHWESCKKLKFEHTNKWYIYNSESVRENEAHNLL